MSEYPELDAIEARANAATGHNIVVTLEILRYDVPRLAKALRRALEGDREGALGELENRT